MKYFLIISLSILNITFDLKADIITLKDGKKLQGQLLRVTQTKVIYEVNDLYKGVYAITIERENVESVMDESKKYLYHNGKQSVANFKDYHTVSYPNIDISTKKTNNDTIKLINGKEIICKIAKLRNGYISYKLRDDLLQNIHFSKISSINNKQLFDHIVPPVGSKKPYPNAILKGGYIFVFHKLSQFNKIIEYVAQEIPGFRNVTLEFTNPVKTFNTEFQIEFNPNMAAGISAYSMDEDLFGIDFFSLEYMYQFPYEYFSPWLGIGYAFQAVEIRYKQSISGQDYIGVDMKLESGKKIFFIACGVKYKFNKYLGLDVSLKHLPFGPQKITVDEVYGAESFSYSGKIDLTNTMFSISAVFDL